MSYHVSKITVNVEDKECNNKPADAVADSETCKTPTAKEFRIHEPLTCPPAPKKPKVIVSAYKKDPKKTVDEIEIETTFFPVHDSSSKKSPRQ